MNLKIGDIIYNFISKKIEIVVKIFQIEQENSLSLKDIKFDEIYDYYELTIIYELENLQRTKIFQIKK